MINLVKGQKINLVKEDNSQLSTIYVGLGWDPAKKGMDIDCDASCILLDSNDKLISDNMHEYAVAYFNLKLPGIKHYGDNLTGSGNGDDETIKIDLDKVNKKVNKIVIVMNVYRGKDRGQYLDSLTNAYIRVYDTDTEYCRFNFDEHKGHDLGFIVAEIYRHNDGWKFAAIARSVSEASYVTEIAELYK